MAPCAQVAAFFTYDAFGNLVHASDLGDSLGAWLEYNRWDMTYNAANFIQTDSFSLRIMGTSTWVGDHSYSTGYTPGVGYYTAQSQVYYNDSTYSIPDGTRLYTKHVSAAGLPDTFYASGTGWLFTNPSLFVAQYKMAFVFDAYGNPTTAYQFYYTVTDTATGAGYFDAAPDITYHYYYEVYQSAAGVNNVAADAQITIYPNPSAGLYTLAASGGVNGARVAVYDMMGQKVYECNLVSGANTQIDLSTRPAGLYVAPGNHGQSGNVLKAEKLLKTE